MRARPSLRTTWMRTWIASSGPHPLRRLYCRPFAASLRALSTFLHICTCPSTCLYTVRKQELENDEDVLAEEQLHDQEEQERLHQAELAAQPFEEEVSQGQARVQLVKQFFFSGGGGAQRGRAGRCRSRRAPTAPGIFLGRHRPTL